MPTQSRAFVTARPPTGSKAIVITQPASPQYDPNFIRKMEQLTGLTGAALLIYLIISEGSRLFPPRNLIPIP
ncbi:hypothetical protein ACAW74_12575 [Fibrella sp. WM1]|uniref:hypothetical protein n=1 Tax=Fibrella musci TaxID=3242485 RepID=UPI003521C3C6